MAGRSGTRGGHGGTRADEGGQAGAGTPNAGGAPLDAGTGGVPTHAGSTGAGSDGKAGGAGEGTTGASTCQYFTGIPDAGAVVGECDATLGASCTKNTDCCQYQHCEAATGTGGTGGAGGTSGEAGTGGGAGSPAPTPCETRADCPADVAWCDPNKLACVECLGLWHCGGGDGSSGQFCFNGECTLPQPLVTGSCTPSLFDCPGGRGFDCAPSACCAMASFFVGDYQYCGNCVTHADCPSDQGCFEGLCSAFRTCTVDSDCGAPPSTCDGSGCVQCTSNTHCKGGLLCDTTIARCRECLKDADCPDSSFLCMGGACWHPRHGS